MDAKLIHSLFPTKSLPDSPCCSLVHSIPGGFGSPFPRRRLLFSIPGGFGDIFLRGRLHFSFPSEKDTLFLRRKLPRSFPGGFRRHFPAQTLVIMLPAQKKILNSRAGSQSTKKNAARDNPCCVYIYKPKAYLQTIISRIILSVVCIPSAPMRPRLQMVFSMQSSMIPSFEEMQMLSIARTAA